MSIRVETFFSQGHLIEVKVQDNQKNQSILLVHGFNDTKETFVFLEGFLKNYFNLVSFDLRGHGNSEWKQDGLYHYSEAILDLHNVVVNFLPEKFVLMGHSLGAGLSARYAGLQPERLKALICLEGFVGFQGWEQEKKRINSWLEQTAKISERIHKEPKRRILTREDALQKLKLIYSSLPIEKVKILLDSLIREEGDGVVWKNDPRIKNTSPIPFPPEFSRFLWKDISCPVLLFFGEKTHIRPKNLGEIKSHFSNILHLEVPNAGHNMHHDNPEFIIEHLELFLHSIL
jgi:pimeloyl-ACP methyl ester carboxylesterase